MIKKINKIIIGTHNRGKFREISHLISDKIKKYSPSELKIKSPKETSTGDLGASWLFKNQCAQAS